MILTKYNYKYALLPKDAAKTIGLGWRKTDKNNNVMVNLSELKQLPGEGTIEDRVKALGGTIMTPEEALYYSKTNTFSLLKNEEKKPEKQPETAPTEKPEAAPAEKPETAPTEQTQKEPSAAQPQVKPQQEEVSQTDKNKVV